VSRQAGVSEIETHGLDGLILEDATDVSQLAGFIDRLISEPEFGSHLGNNPVGTAHQYTWDVNAEQLFRTWVEAQVP